MSRNPRFTPDGELNLPSVVSAESRAVDDTTPLMPRGLAGLNIPADHPYRLFAENSPDAIVTTDQAGRVVYANRAIYGVLGYDPADLVGRDFGVLLPDRRQSTDTPAWPPARVGQFYGRHRDGRIVRIEPSFGEYTHGGLTYCTVVLRDVTDRLRVQQERRRSSMRLEALLTWSSEVTTVVDAEGRIGYASPSSSRIFGYEPRSLLRRMAYELVHPDDQKDVAGAFREVLDRPRELRVLQCRLRHADGVWRHFEMRLRNLLDEPSVQGIVINSVDITDRIETEAALRSSEDKLRRLVEGVLDYAIYTLDVTGRISSWNAGAQRMKGWVHDDVLGRDFAMFFPPEDVADGVPLQILQNATRYGSTTAEGWRVTRTGDRVWSAGVIDAIHDDDGSLLGFAIITRDLTERKRTAALLEEKDQQLLHAQRLEAIGQLAGGVAHDFNNILTAIGGFTRLLLLDLDPADARAEHVHEIERAQGRAAELTSRLLTFSRMRTSSPQCVDLNAVIRSLEPMLRRLLGEDVLLETELSATAPVLIDPGQLEQVVMNLTVNARDAMPLGGRILIRTAGAMERFPGTTRDRTAVQLLVSDEGCGMDAAVRARIFEPFFTTKPDGSGTGLGLSMVAGIVSTAGGSVRVTSAPARGTTFRIVLPRADTPVARHIAGSAERGELPRGRGTILVTEDDPSVRLLTRTVLRRSGYTVIEAPDAEEAVRLFEAADGAVSLLITDAILPGMNGYVLAQTLLAQQPDLKVLFVSGYAEDVLAKRGILFPDITLLPKPFVPEDLLHAVTQVLVPVVT